MKPLLSNKDKYKPRTKKETPRILRLIGRRQGTTEIFHHPLSRTTPSLQKRLPKYYVLLDNVREHQKYPIVRLVSKNPLTALDDVIQATIIVRFWNEAAVVKQRQRQTPANERDSLDITSCQTTLGNNRNIPSSTQPEKAVYQRRM